MEDAASIKDGCEFASEMSDVIKRWAEMYESLVRKEQYMEEHRNEVEMALQPCMFFEDHDIDKILLEDTQSGLGRVTLQHMASKGMRTRDFESDHLLSMFMVHPAGHLHFSWGVASYLLLGLDLFTMPLMLFDLGDGRQVIFGSNICSTVFWTLDVILHFFIGVTTDEGGVDMRPATVATLYLKGWFPIDLGLLLCDAFVISFELLFAPQFQADEAVAGSRSLALTRLVRMIRLVRVFRMRKASAAMNMLRSRLQSEYSVHAVHLAQQVFFLILVSHYIACLWLAIAIFNISDEATWLAVFGFEDTAIFYRYCVSLHWALTQFSPATNNIAPQNLRERLFAIVVVLFALVVFSSFVSSVTNSVNQLRVLNQSRTREESAMREFMRVRGISSDLNRRILEFFSTNFAKRQNRIKMQDIKFMNELPDRFRRSLRKEIFLPHLLASHLLILHNEDPGLMQRLAHNAMEEVAFLPWQEVFVKHAMASGCYCTINGKLFYETASRVDRSAGHIDGEDIWLAEMVLWMKWVHRGALQARTCVELIEIHSSRAVQVLCAVESNRRQFLQKFGVLCLAYVENTPNLSDLPIPEEAYEEIYTRSKKFSRLGRSMDKALKNSTSSTNGRSTLSGGWAAFSEFVPNLKVNGGSFGSGSFSFLSLRTLRSTITRKTTRSPRLSRATP